MKKEKIPVFLCLAGLWIRIRMDLHPFYLLDPDPGGKNSNKKGRKIHRNWYWYRYPVVIVIYKKKNISTGKFGLAERFFFTFEQYFLSFSIPGNSSKGTYIFLYCFAGSGLAFKSRCIGIRIEKKQLDPDPQTMNVDPQPCCPG